ncbi:MAG: site-specific integrase [Acuticoccus sp.]
MTSFVDVADALTQILPVYTAERLADHLTPADVATLRDLVRASVTANTLRAVASDLAYLEAWHVASTGFYLAWPPSDAAALSFIAHHLFRPAERMVRGEGYGMPKDTEAELRAAGVLRGALPHAPATVSRRLSSWRRVAQARGCEAALTSSAVRQALSAATKASERQKGRHSQTAVTRKVLDRLIGDTDPALREFLSLRELRDRTLLLVAFATGGRRRSELGALLRIEQIFALSPGPSSSSRPASTGIAVKSGSHGLGIAVGRTKTTNPQDGEHLVVTGRAQAYLEAWLAALQRVRQDIEDGPIFRLLDRWNNVGNRGLSGEAVNVIVKKSAAAVGLDPKTVLAHGLRAGYLTEASLKGVPIEAAMRHSLHRSVQSAVRYNRDEERASGKAAKLAG